MQQWLVFAVVALVWAVAVLVIVVFMIGASRDRHRQREHDQAGAEQPLGSRDT